MFSKVYKERDQLRALKAIQAKEAGDDFVVRDNITHHEIARGTYDEMRAYQAGFGYCYLEAA